MLCPHHQVTNGVGLLAHTGRVIISHQPPSSVQQVKDPTLAIDLLGQWSCNSSASLITS